MSELRKTLLSKGSNRFALGNNDYTPLKWSTYFERQQQIQVKNAVFNTFMKGKEGPVLLCLHGGGYSGLTWSLFAEEIVNRIDCQVLAVDLRGHGETTTPADSDLSLETLAGDVHDIIESIYGEDVPPIILIGHSMGGAIAVEVCRILQQVVAICVIDVVEGTALESLSSMQSVLRGRPKSFKSVESAIQWSFRGGQTHNLEAARVSMPGQIKNSKTGELAAVECCRSKSVEDPTAELTEESNGGSFKSQPSEYTIQEETEDEIASTTATISNPIIAKPPRPSEFKSIGAPFPYVWRIDLSKTEHFWSGWFKDLSQKFLNIAVPKVLLLANIHGLDTVLTVGQMQGKFQLQVLQKSGHAIHEDQPHQVAEIVAGFLVKQKLAFARNHFIPAMPAC